MNTLLNDLISLLEEDISILGGERLSKRDLIALFKTVQHNQEKPSNKKITFAEMRLKLARKRSQTYN
jgi:hypothetical protein